MGRRSYGGTGAETALFGGEFARGLRKSGVIDCGKPFPGSGLNRVDTHFSFVRNETSEVQIRYQLLPPFQKVMQEGMQAIGCMCCAPGGKA